MPIPPRPNRQGSRQRPPSRRRVRGHRPWVDILEQRALLAVAIAEIPIPSGNTPVDIAAGPDGNLWFTEAAREIGRLDPATGAITEFPVPATGVLGNLTAGGDGNVWFLENPVQGNLQADVKVGRITPDGTVTEFPIPGTGGSAWAITRGPDGNVWAIQPGQIDRITPAGNVTVFPLANISGNSDIIAGSDGNLWFVTDGVFAGKITPDGVITVLPTELNGGYIAHNGMALMPDGDIDVLEQVALAGPHTSDLDVITPAGTITTFGGAEIPESIAVAPDGSLWTFDLSREGGPPNGPVGFYGAGPEFITPPTEGTTVGEIVAGPDGNLWFTEPYSNRIGQIVLNAPALRSLSAQGFGSINVAVGTTFTAPLASFTPLNASDTPDDYKAQVYWGEGPSTEGTITPDGSGHFVVSGSHAYQASSGSSGRYGVLIVITDVQVNDPGSNATAGTSINVLPGPSTLSAQGAAPLWATTGTAVLATLATFSPLNASDTSDDYTASVDWGDGTIAPADIIPDGVGGFRVEGSHTYTTVDNYRPSITITDVQPSAHGAAARVGTSISVTAIPVEPPPGNPTPVIFGAQAHNLMPRAGLAIGTDLTPPPGEIVPAETEVAHFGLTTALASIDGYAATINWGDGSAPSAGIVAVGGSVGFPVAPDQTPCVILGSHTYQKVGTYSFTVTLTTASGTTVVMHGQAQVTPTPVPFTGGLVAASDSGYSNHDGLTADATPTFRGTTTPGATVQLLATRPGDSTAFPIGQTKAGPSGGWAITTTQLADGTYTITAKITAANGSSRSSVPVATTGARNTLVVDTTGPRISSAVLDPATGEITLDFQDNLSQVNPLGLTVRGAVQVAKIVPGGLRPVDARVASLAHGGRAATLGVGHSLASGRYVLEVAAASVRDAAGNALDGEFDGAFPTGDGHAGGTFLAEFVVRGKKPTSPLPIGGTV